ncbi:MAG: hypothetical protein ACFE96_14280 [Candidatus Hermodarchaeota archaeon]
MKEQVSKLLKLLFLIHFFVAVIFGLLFTVLTELYVDVVGWYYYDPITGRVLGAVFLGLAAASLLSWREEKWESVKIVVQMEIVWLLIGTAVHFFAAFVFPVPFIIWIQTGILIFFLVSFVWFYYDQEFAKK